MTCAAAISTASAVSDNAPRQVTRPASDGRAASAAMRQA